MQESVLGLQLFTIFIDDIGNKIKYKLLKFADDTNIGKILNTQIKADVLQSDLNLLNKWGKTWLMEFDLDKCVCMHVSTNNKNFNYDTGCVNMKFFEKEKDLGILIDKNFKLSEHSAAVDSIV